MKKVCSCSTTKRIWEILEVIHEGRNQMKESTMKLLTHQYEVLKIDMKQTKICFPDLLTFLVV